jgi:hypothetical protein
MKRLTLFVAAAGFFVWENVVAARWLGSDGLRAGLTHAWSSLRQDGLVLLVFVDMGVFALAALVWLARDLQARTLSRQQRASWFVATMLIGSPVLLTYLAFRPSHAERAGVHSSLAPLSDLTNAEADKGFIDL